MVRNICFIGAGFVGGPSGAVVALKNPDIRVTVVDLSEERISAWKTNNLPLYEPGLLEVTQASRDGSFDRPQNLFFSTNVAQSIKESEIIFICVNTPTKIVGLGAGRASNLSYVESATRLIATEAESDKIIVEKSTVPCRTADAIRKILHATSRPGIKFDVLSNPEFLAEGTAINDLLLPDRVLIGSLRCGSEAAQKLSDLYATWVPRNKILHINLWSSELAKLAANALLAQRISSINTLSAICEATGADVDEIALAAGLDSRIGSKMLQASVGFGGSCFRKDVLNLAYMAESLHLPEVAAYWQSVVAINEWQKDRFTKRIVRCLYDTVSSKKIAVFGFAYKKNTSDTRETAAISVVEGLLAEGAHISVYDPQVSEHQIRAEINDEIARTSGGRLSVADNAYDAATDSHAIVILTEWNMFSNRGIDVKNDSALPSPIHSTQESPIEEKFDVRMGATSKPGTRLDWFQIMQSMRKPAFVFDGRRIMDVDGLEKMGFRVESIGKGSH